MNEGTLPSNVDRGKDSRALWPPQFKARVDDARVRLMSGEPAADIIAEHGRIVVESARALKDIRRLSTD
jgi:hypothetical protein